VSAAPDIARGDDPERAAYDELCCYTCERAIEAWCASVWAAFSGNREAVAALLEG
jgi:hypothetical protein